MSMRNSGSAKGSIPSRWLHCPRKGGELIKDKFLVFKTPLSQDYDDQVPEECRFTVKMLFDSIRSQNLKMGLWIDLTNTSRFYDRAEVEVNGCQYTKIRCRGHGETPSVKLTQKFVKICKKFIINNPNELIGIHCTHGFNRTGFLLTSYLIESDICHLDIALNEFATARSPGIYKEDYIKELYKRYDDVSFAASPPSRPSWCLDKENLEEDKNETPFYPEKYNQRQIVDSSEFMRKVPGVTPECDQSKIDEIRKKIQKLCGSNNSTFPGSQPAQMDPNNIHRLHYKPYRVTWKADGTRYMMFIQANKEIFLINENNDIFQVHGFSFPHPRDHSRMLKDTLLDGEIVIDKVNGIEYPRYLAYDIILWNGEDVSQLSFFPNRHAIIKKEVIEPRNRAFIEGRLRRDGEPFSIRVKEFWDLPSTNKIENKKFALQLGHNQEGLIFWPSKESYGVGNLSEALEWKASSLISSSHLIDYIDQFRFYDDDEEIGPPPKRMKH